MPLDHETPFYRTHEKSKDDTFTVKLNPQERIEFNEWKTALHQKKDSTAIKQLARLGAKVLLDPKNIEIQKILLNNYRKNKRLGIVEFEEK